jgi:hypothetical protein
MRFNRANERLAAGDAAEASVLYREARRDATDDLELRYAASFNLGMAAAAEADGLEASRPKEALGFLHEAADWFREAVAMRPDEDDPRTNLEVVLRRALILADEIARKSQRDIEGELDQLIVSQRARVADSAILLEAVARAGELAAAESLRAGFDAAATAQRELMADAEALGDRVADEKAILDAKPEAERTPQSALRGASLDGVLAYLDQAVERMGQTRRQLRQRSGERSYRRGAEALDLLKRARDQLRDPVEQIGVLIGEVTVVARSTSVLAGASDAAKSTADEDAEGARLPAFLTAESIGADTTSVAARVGELAERFAGAAARAAQAAATAGSAGAPATAVPPGGAAGEDPAVSERLREALTQAAPLVTQASQAMTRAVGSVSEQKFPAAIAADGEAATALGEAQELFFDLRQLLDVAHATEARIAAAATLGEQAAEARALRERSASVIAAAQDRNRARANRLEALLASEREAEIAALHPRDPSAPPESEPPAADPEQQAALEQRFIRASELLAEAKTAMAEAGSGFGADPSRSKTDWRRVGPPAERATERLDALRMLFLSLLEHLQRLEREQVDLGDRTRDAIALAAGEASSTGRGPETKARIGALADEQKTLEGRAGAIADALLAQSESASGSEAAAPSAGAPSDGASGPDRDTLRRAADHVATAQLAMGAVASTFEDESRPLAPASQAQDEAHEALRKAIELLAPPPPPPEQNESKESPKDDSGAGPQEQPSSGDESGAGDQGQEQSEQGGAGEEEQQQEPSSAEDGSASASEDQMAPPAGGQDPGQLLQGVRDREAERRDANERRGRERRRSAPVEKDW